MSGTAMTAFEFDFSRYSGAIKPMHAVNNGPKMKTGAQTRYTEDSYREAHIPYARNHDASFCSDYGENHTVDVNFIFPDFDADPYDPDNYDFAFTDKYIEDTLSCGTETFYRLGSRIEHGIKKYNTKPPKDYKKFAVICEHIIRHMNFGWADGHSYGITYWEIWNEPELNNPEDPECWGGTDEEFFDFFETAAKHLKSCFPELKIGGPASCGIPSWIDRFLSEMSRKNVPLDFFSWHIYTCEPGSVTDLADRVRGMLDKYGYSGTESILDEWNYIKGWSEDFTYSVMKIHGMKGAAFAADVMIRSQHHSADMLMYYDARPGTCFNGLWDFYDCHCLETFYSFKMFSSLYALGTQVPCNESADGISALAATDRNGRGGIMLAYYSDCDTETSEKSVRLILRGTEVRSLSVSFLDSERKCEKITRPAADSLEITVRPQTVVYIAIN